ncbi:MAG: spermidine/putrescine ABC transporter permease [Rhodospirillaceae bacterium]|nr:spermidine/putrescine ABC transporter permease [Rhodospirillaceae bacterium]|tara:strand:+ start:745 stop:1503 length:759 start_codon:yes stop_codon:yes gene_type:complete
MSFSVKQGLIGIELSWVLDNYYRALEPVYVKILGKSILIAGITTMICFAVGLPVAIAVTRMPRRWKFSILLILILPFWINLLIRTYALIAILRTRGFVNTSLEWIAVRLNTSFEPLELLYNDSAIVLGLIYIHLPFMILPIYAGLEYFDENFKEAALDLGSSTRQLYWYVVLPVISPSILAGCILVFVSSLGSYLTPELLGGADSQLIANVIERQFKHANDWPFGAALSMTLIYMTFGLLAFWLLMVRRKRC